MPTLNHHRKQAGYKSIKAFAEAAQQAGARIYYPMWTPDKGYHTLEREISPSIVSQWLNGERGDINPEPLLTLLNITSEQYFDAAHESREEARNKWREKHPVTQEMLDAHEASIKKTADEIYARMSPEQKARLHQETERRRNRSPLDIMIDRACGIE